MAEHPGAPAAERPAGELVAWALREGAARLYAAHTALSALSARSEAAADGGTGVAGEATGAGAGVPLDEAVHDLRVAARRLRSRLQAFAPFLSGAATAELRDGLAELGRVLGPLRDVQVCRGRLAASAGAWARSPEDTAAVARLDQLLAGRQDEALARVMELRASPSWPALLEQVRAFAAAPPLTAAAAQPSQVALPPRLARAWRRVVRATAGLQPGDPEDLWHRARIRAKQLRYTAEACAPTLGRPVARLVEVATGLQELLGGRQDALGCARTVLALAAAHPQDGPLGVAAGRVAERELAAAAAAEAALSRARRRLGRRRMPR